MGLLVLAAACKDNPKTEQPKREALKAEPRVDLTYSMIIGKDSVKQFIAGTDSQSLAPILAVNRRDKKSLAVADTLLVPNDRNQKIQQYLPFPFAVEGLRDINKIIFFSYPAQAFAAYENGMLKYTGPTSMGRKADQTPTGLFYCNWKAEETTSTFNDEWDLKWNFNIENKLGVGFHQYEMPGYPASHSCLRLTEADAKLLYNWADQWKLEGTDNIIAYGTPVIVFGSYPFGSPRPWLALASNPKALLISDADVEGLVKPHMADILAKQAERGQLAN